MTRTLWFVAGAGVGVYGMVRGRRAAEAFTAEGLHDRMTALFLGARMFRDEVAQGAAERETELRERFGVLPHERPHTPELPSTESRGQH
jgi:hypothetical protein